MIPIDSWFQCLKVVTGSTLVYKSKTHQMHAMMCPFKGRYSILLKFNNVGVCTQFLLTTKDRLQAGVIIDKMLKADLHYKWMCKKCLKLWLWKAQNFAKKFSIWQWLENHYSFKWLWTDWRNLQSISLNFHMSRVHHMI